MEQAAQAHGSLSLNTFACTAVKSVYTNGAKWVDELLAYLKYNMDYVVEQNANMALKTADLAYVLETGTITKFGTGAELLNDESIKEAYLGKRKN